ncbi:MAG: hypothetical protein JNJ57_15980 [Saprospiraceae bacterium]|nr:hypothetical protein [Saprospiraceae bacterium]
MKINYNQKIFRPVVNSDNGEVSGETTFYYQQHDQIVTGSYGGGEILLGHLIAVVEPDGCLDMRYHHLNRAGELQTGVCRSVPEILPNGKIRLHETWRWTSGDGSTGHSIIEEVDE